jgi:16S rRNA (guanine966-N2)-methyltransferase
MATAVLSGANWLDMRVIAGIYGSRKLKSPQGMKLRPTSDRLRETLFNVLGPQIEGARFVDLYAGTGAVGIEALSRGAAEAVFIEEDARAAKLIQQNLESLGIKTGAVILRVEALRGIEMLAARHEAVPNQGVDIVCLDPPWTNEKEYARVLAALGSASFLSPGARVVAEHRRQLTLSLNYGALRLVRVIKEGDAALSFFSAR